MASVTVKTTNSPNRKCATTVYWQGKVFMVQNLILTLDYIFQVLLFRLEISSHGLWIKRCHCKVFLHMVLLYKGTNL